MTEEGGTTAAVFAAHLQQALLSALRPGQVMVDDVGAHEPDRMPALVEAAGACTRAALDAATAVALAAVTGSDAAGWSTHTGPPPPARRR